MPTDVIPSTTELFSPVMKTIRDLGGSATTDEMNQRIIADLDLSEEAQQVMRADGRYPRILTNLSEARSRLRKIGWLEQSRRGVWAVTEDGETKRSDDFARVHSLYRQALEEERAAQGQGDGIAAIVDGAPLADEAEDDEETVEPETWQQALVNRLMLLSPEQFERVAQRLLREAGFTDVKVTNRGADGGIDGEGQYRLGLLTFPVYWQSKRWAKAVSAPDVQGFRGALSTQVGARGLFITTSTFTVPAQQEAAKAPQIDLIDGQRLADLMKEYGVGVRATQTMIEDVSLVPEFFDGL